MKNRIAKILTFLKPDIIKLFFLVEWILLVLYSLVWDDLSLKIAVTGSFLPLAFFYLLASMLSAISQDRQRLANGANLHLLALALAFIDQLGKVIVSLSKPYQDSHSILPGVFNIANERNLYGSWLLEKLDFHLNASIILVFFVLPFLLVTLLVHSYYTNRHHQSVWVDAAYLGLFSGLLSAAVDMLLRGYTLDYLQIPGIVTADLKDVLITIAIASIFAEGYTNPDTSLLRWYGWHKEIIASRQLVEDVFDYTRQEIARLRLAVMKGWKERFRS